MTPKIRTVAIISSSSVSDSDVVNRLAERERTVEKIVDHSQRRVVFDTSMHLSVEQRRKICSKENATDNQRERDEPRRTTAADEDNFDFERINRAIPIGSRLTMMMENVRHFFLVFRSIFSVQKEKNFFNLLLMSVQTAEDINSSSSTPVLSSAVSPSKVVQSSSAEHAINGQENIAIANVDKPTDVKNGDEAGEVHVNGQNDKASTAETSSNPAVAAPAITQAEEAKTIVTEDEVKDKETKPVELAESVLSNTADSGTDELKSAPAEPTTTSAPEESVSATSTTAETTESATPDKKSRVSFDNLCCSR